MLRIIRMAVLTCIRLTVDDFIVWKAPKVNGPLHLSTRQSGTENVKVTPHSLKSTSSVNVILMANSATRSPSSPSGNVAK